MVLNSAYVQANEVVKAEDITLGFDSSIENISATMQAIFDKSKNFVINGKVTPYSGGGMNVSVAPIFGVNKKTGTIFLNTENTEPITIENSWNVDRIDIIEVESKTELTNEEQRAFINFDTKEKTLLTVETQSRLYPEIKVKHNINSGSFIATAPETSDKCIKLCEIFVPANATDISHCTIYNISTDISGVENTGWTNEKSDTYNVGTINTINEKLRVEHNQDGSHKNAVIHKNNIDIGTGSNQLNANVEPIAGTVSTSDSSKTPETSILATLQFLATKINDIYTPYLKNGEYVFNGETVIGDGSTEYDADTAIKIGANGDGSAYFKIGNKKIFDITTNGVIRVNSTYLASNDYDLINKKVTDSLSQQIKSINESINLIDGVLEVSNTYVNNLYGRYSYGINVNLVSTANVAILEGTTTRIDGVTAATGYKVLLKDQDDAKQNGIYEVQTGVWNRLTGYGNNSDDMATYNVNFLYKLFSPTQGTQAGKIFYLARDTQFEIGVDDIIFSKALFEKKSSKNTLVMRDDSGNIITDTFVGNVIGNVIGNVTGTLNGHVNGSAASADKLGIATVGDSVNPIYLDSGNPMPCDKYAGGTAVTVNGQNKQSSEVSLYAPTTAGINRNVEAIVNGVPKYVTLESIFRLPIGFIYHQYYNPSTESWEKSPEELFNTHSWEDITSQFSNYPYAKIQDGTTVTGHNKQHKHNLSNGSNSQSSHQVAYCSSDGQQPSLNKSTGNGPHVYNYSLSTVNEGSGSYPEPNATSVRLWKVVGYK